MVFMNMRVDSLLMKKHVSQCVEEIIHHEEHWKRYKHIRPSDIVGIP